MLARSVMAAAALLAVHGDPAQERSPGVRRLAFVLEVDVERARAVGWEGADAAEVVGLAARLVERRFLAMERAARVAVEDGRIVVSLPSIDPRDRELFEGMLRSIGLCELLFVASDELLAGMDTDLEKERRKLDAWREANPDEPIDVFNALPPEQQGPHRRVAWFETDYRGHSGPSPPYAVLLPDKPDDHIGAGSFARTYAALDVYGYPAIGFELTRSRADDFARVTGAHVNQRLAIVIDGKIRSAPTLMTRLVGGGLIEGRFTQEEFTRITGALRKLEGPLRVVEIR